MNLETESFPGELQLLRSENAELMAYRIAQRLRCTCTPAAFEAEKSASDEQLDFIRDRVGCSTGSCD